MLMMIVTNWSWMYMEEEEQAGCAIRQGIIEEENTSGNEEWWIVVR